MANEYGYETNGSVLGGIGQLIDMKNQQDKLDQQKAAVPFLNSALHQYLGGNQLPNFSALAPFVSASQGLSESGVNTARAGELGAETNRMNTLLPGEVAHQGFENTGLNQDNQIRGGSMADLIAAPGIRNQYEQSEMGRNNAETATSNARLPYIGPESEAGINRTNAEAGLEQAQTQNANTEGRLMQPKFDMEQQQFKYNMDPNNPENQLKTNEGAEALARAKNFDAESSMYSPQGGQQAIPGSGVDPRVRQAVLNSLGGGGAGASGADTQQPQSQPFNLMHLIYNMNHQPEVQAQQDDERNTAVRNMQNAQANEQMGPPQPSANQDVQRLLAGRAVQLTQLEQQMEKAKANPDVYSPQDLAQLQQKFEFLTKSLQQGRP